ncbi:MAG: transporter substrate-binding domain-containing protein [Clostridia bacterium]|nr:transporter substrate-binding domain-containing protein [Clostridia bacterium]
MKRFFSLILALLLCALPLCACSSSQNHNKFVILEENFGDELYAIGFRKGDVALMLTVQTQLDAMMADGKAAEISTKWFGSDKLLKDQAFPNDSAVSAGDNSLQYILDKGTFIVGLDPAFPPMGYTDDTTGELVGFDIDLAREVCRRLEVELVLQPIDWSAKEMELANKSIDCIWNGFSVNDERIAALTLSKPYLANAQIIMVPEGSDIKTKADLVGKTVGLQSGSSAYEAVMADSIASSIGKVEEYADNLSAFMDLKAGRIDAFVVDRVVGEYMLTTDAE